jgi:energy-coupling factor transporter ATP-binding protein EcfA2
VGTVIEFKNVTYTYPLSGKPAIKNLSCQIEAGGFYGVIGANGSGKTTLCSLIRGFVPNFYKGDLKGEVLVAGKPTTTYGPGELALKIGYVFQNPFNQISGVKDTVFEEVAFGLENFGVAAAEIERRVIDVMEMTNITAIAFKNPFELSGGQQQRVALASTIVLKPDILVIDEPTSQLDPEGTESVFKIISEMKNERKTIILVEHKVDLIAEYADTIFVFNEGELIKAGPKRDILTDLSLLEQKVQLPQMAILGHELRKHGLALEIPITESQAVEAVKVLLAKGGTSL